MAWILDLDGVIWLGDAPIPGSAEAVAKLRAAGERVLFLTNNSASRVGDYVTKLAKHGIVVTAHDVCSSAMAAATCVRAGERALVIAGPGAQEALEARGVVCVDPADAGDFPDVDVVVVGFHRNFDFSRLTSAFRAVYKGARLLGTNDDATYPSSEGPFPGGGSLVAAVAYAAGVEAEFAGKPFPPTAALVFDRLGLPSDPTAQQRAELTMVGDRLSTDGQMGKVFGGRFALVLSGVTTSADAPYSPHPDLVGANLGDVVDQAFQ
jgi:HAD superfamily hydrolase (TIGR01450 family)